MAIVLLPVLCAIWTVPGFVTQDGPTHLYNAWILSCSFTSPSPYQDYFVVQWQPLPNWVGHLALAGLLEVVSPWSADRIMMSVTLVGFASGSRLVALACARRTGSRWRGACWPRFSP